MGVWGKTGRRGGDREEGWSQGEKGRREGLRPREGRGEGAKGFVTYSYFNALEKEMATHSSVLAWRILMGCHLWGRTESDTTEVTTPAALPRY